MAGFNDPSKREIDVGEGDTLTFHWQGGKHHNVWSLPTRKAFDNCDFSVGHKVGDTSPVTYKVGTYPTHYFGCKTLVRDDELEIALPKGHCLAGQKLAVTGDIKL